MALSICVFCGSRSGKNPVNEVVARQLGLIMAAHGWQLVYGGGSVGLMGVVARAVLEGGGAVVGVIPQALQEAEVGLEDATELIVPQTLRERKAIMDARSQAFVALPGGYGTFEELLETITLRQLGYHDKPIIVLNINGYYDPLIALFNHAIEQGFIRTEHADLYQVVATVDEIVALLRPYEKMQ
ncbi:MAG: TIGR00730 family Rossman fold protein [Chloroflexaceae bacterium]|nr:TIGR00730 family Rossman fold protein [Chloroflexaceae bacterium]